MSSLSKMFEKRGKKGGDQQLGNLFNQQNVKKYQNLAEEKEDKPVYLPPEPKHEEPEDLESTIFVGNVPLSLNHGNLKKIFGVNGKISKVWFRSVPVEQTILKRKANCILKNYQQGADSKNAYVKFQQKSAAEKACSLNGHRVEEHTLRVSLCLDDNLDYQTTVFVGNLHLDIKEEELRRHFEPAGQIVNVRVVKDKRTLKGIGIGYVRFADKNVMFNALKIMNGTILKERPLRVKRAIEKGKLQKKINRVAQKKLGKKGYTPPQNAKPVWNVGLKQSQRNAAANADNTDEKQIARKFHFKRKMIKK